MTISHSILKNTNIPLNLSSVSFILKGVANHVIDAQVKNNFREKGAWWNSEH